MSDIRVDNIKNEAGTGSPGFPYGASITGVATATSFVGNLTGNVTVMLHLQRLLQQQPLLLTHKD